MMTDAAGAGAGFATAGRSAHVEELDRAREVKARLRAALDREDPVPERDASQTVSWRAHVRQGSPPPSTRLVDLHLSDGACGLLAAEHHHTTTADRGGGDPAPGLAHRRQPLPAPAARPVAFGRRVVAASL